MVFLLTALAAPVHNGVQVQLHPPAFEFLEQTLAGSSVDYGPTNFAAEVSCYDIAVSNFNLTLDVQSIALTPHAGGLDIDMQFEARGTYINVVGETGWLDTCFNFERLIELIELQEGHLQGSMRADVSNGALDLSFTQPPAFTGTFVSDVDWFPDDLVWSYVEGMVLEKANEALETQVPALVRDLTAETLLVDVLGTPVGLGLTDVQTHQDGLYAGISLDLGGQGGTGPVFDLAPRDGSHFAVGVTQPLITDALDVAWASGLLDLQSEANQALVNDLITGLDLGEGIDASVSLGVVPAVQVDAAGIHLGLNEVGLVVRSEGTELLTLAVDLGAQLDVGVEAGSFVLSAHEVTIAVRELDADALLTEARSEEDVRRFLEGWVARAASVAIADRPIYATHAEVLDTVVRVNAIERVDQGVAMWASLYDEDDPEVDRIAPDTTVELTAEGTSVTATFGASDDRSGPLLLSWRVNGGGWSSWSEETEAVFEVEPGFHTVEVIARDAWHNVDPTPALGQFQLDGPLAEVPEESKGGCSVATGSSGWLALVALLTRRIRR